jgi:hypothetical protein
MLDLFKIVTKRQMLPTEITINNKIIFKKIGLLNFIKISKKTISDKIKIEKYKYGIRNII